ncbi:Ger(x)C family spore germination protein [Bacillus sp. FJAT-28004]|uniref:Ger(x)C family spore germination protein n=1 Tax=Bacillus sp. FJAT-28004 TaxID=1679165 RepID=UPI0006B43CA2|nr:Ger(x)C family spore germination protein [Bacillus sp. FJAT-28004]
MYIFRAISLLLCSSILILNGCTGTPEIQNMAYATAIGIDFKDGKWIAYAQILNFSNISHSEQVTLGQPVPVWVGKGEGETVALALTDISRTAQLQVFWGHVKAVVMTEAVLKKSVTDVYSAINRYREVRYNILIYGTKREIPDILVQKSILNLSPLETIMFTATQMSSPISVILPVTVNRVIADLNEPGEPAMIPSIDLDTNDWMEDKQAKPMFALSGGYFFKQNKMIGWMSVRDLQGIRWAEKGLKRIPLKVSAHGSPAAVIEFSSPKMRISPVKVNGETRFNLEVEANGYVIELMQDVTMNHLKDRAADAIRKEITSTYRKAIKQNIDPFHLRESLYRSSPLEFRRLSGSDAFFLKNDSLGEIKININLLNTGKYKGTKN